eukprot:Sspe_Gene.77499::Locus_48431_Transcript_1_1_Confidence_1.000_Length_1241::g.77499::m.77499/K15296/NAPA, SNAPA, SEC17; alpha-soluble NSF attachment protein
MAEAAGDEFMLKGDKKTKKFFGGSSKYEDARDLYQQGAIQYKKARSWEKAAAAFMRCYEMAKKLECRSDQVQDLLDAAVCYRKFDYNKGIERQREALQLLEREGRYSRCAKLCVEIAEVLEEQRSEVGSTDDLLRTIAQCYSDAAGFWKLERNSTQSIADCRKKEAEILLQLSDGVEKAMEIYEELGRQCAEDAMLRFNAKGHFFMALLCQLSLISSSKKEEGIDHFRSKFDDYQQTDLQFTPQTREHELMTKIIEAFEENDPKIFTEAQREYEKICPLDHVKRTLLLKAKTVLKTENLC